MASMDDESLGDWTAGARWWALPDVGLGPQCELLATFQRIVELQESSRIILDLSTSRTPDHHHSDLRVRGPARFCCCCAAFP